MRLAVDDWQRCAQRALDIAAARSKQSPPDAAAGEAREVAGAAASGWQTTTSRSSAIASTGCDRGRTEDVLEADPGNRPRHPARRRGKRRRSRRRCTGELREHAREADLLTITKANSISTVHRATYLDYVGIKTFDKPAASPASTASSGLFTSAVYNRSPREIPLLRHKIERVVAHFGLDPASHDGKAVVHVLETYPRDELFQARVADLIRIVRGVVNLYERQRVRVLPAARRVRPLLFRR